MNNVILMGNLTKNPSSIITEEGHTICHFRMAINTKIKDKQETFFINVTCFGTLATNCQKYLIKGARVVVEGRLKTDSYQAKDGTQKSELIIIANDVHFISHKKGESDAIGQ